MEEQITETGTDGLAAPSADELRAVEEISEEALADAENAAETGDITDSLGLYLRESRRHALLTAEEEVELAAAAAAGSSTVPRVSVAPTRSTPYSSQSRSPFSMLSSVSMMCSAWAYSRAALSVLQIRRPLRSNRHTT